MLNQKKNYIKKICKERKFIKKILNQKIIIKAKPFYPISSFFFCLLKFTTLTRYKIQNTLYCLSFFCTKMSGSSSLNSLQAMIIL